MAEHPSPSGPSASSASSGADSARNEILATAAHDLKNPLGAIFGYADVLLESALGSSLSDKQREIIGRVRTTAARSLELVRNYQQLAELAERSGQVEPGKCDVAAVVRAVVEYAYREDPAAHQVHLALPSTPLVAKIDRIQLDRVLSNLFGNALRYTPRGGSIVLRARAEGSFILLEVANTGASIAPDEMPHLFSRHFRARSSQGTSGTGLGLYIVKQILEGIHGSIFVTSDPATGTTFTIKIPAAN